MPRKKKKKLSQRIEEKFMEMSWPKRLLYTAALMTAALTVGGAFGQAANLIDRQRPWAMRETERVVAAMQIRDYSADLRDIEGRIVRLETKRKINPRSWTQQDESELRYWYNQRAALTQILQQLQQHQKPYYR